MPYYRKDDGKEYGFKSMGIWANGVNLLFMDSKNIQAFQSYIKIS